MVAMLRMKMFKCPGKCIRFYGFIEKNTMREKVRTHLDMVPFELQVGGLVSLELTKMDKGKFLETESSYANPRHILCVRVYGYIV